MNNISMDSYSQPWKNLTDQDRQVLIINLLNVRTEIGEPIYSDELEFALRWVDTTVDTLRRMILDGSVMVDIVLEETEHHKGYKAALYLNTEKKDG